VTAPIAGPGYALEVKNLPPFTTRYGSKMPNVGSRRATRAHNAELRHRPSRFRTMSTSTKYAETYAAEERFRKAYADIWGLDRAKKRFQDELYFPPEDLKVVASIEREEGIQSVVRRKPRSTTRAFKGFVRPQPVRRPYEAQERGQSYYRSISIAHTGVPQVRTKYLRLTTSRTGRPVSASRLEEFSSLWSYYFTQLSRRYDSQLDRYRVPRPIQIRGVVNSIRSFERVFSNASLQEVRKAWESLTQTERELSWVQVMLGALGRRPSWALKFLIASTRSEPYPPSYAISDSLEYIVCYFLYKVKGPDVRSVTTIFRIVMGLLDNFDHYYLHLSQKTIFWLLSHISVDQAEHFYKVLVHRSHPLHENTLLQFAHTFAREGRIQLAIDILQRFHNNGGDFAQPKVESVCSTILERKHRENSASVMSDSDIFGLLLDFGLRPNIIFYNILLQNAAESGDSETAWRIHDMMPGLGIEADANTYSILLTDAKLRMDQPAMKRIVEIVELKGITTEYIITDLLHAMFLTYEQERKATHMHTPPSTPLKRMLPLYAEYFDLEPIRGLLTQGYRDLAVPSDRPKMHPSKATLVVMLIALLRGFTNPTSAPEWYQRFRTMVLSGHPDIAPLAESTHIYDAVIMCLARWPVTLRLCTRVISDMFSSYAAAQKVQKRLNLPIRNGNMLQTTMGSFASTPLSSMHSLRREEDESRINQVLDGLQAERSAVKFAEDDVDAIDEYPSKNSKPTKFSPTPLKAAVEASEQSVDQVVIHGHCKPSVYTWSILLKAFMDHSQPRAAEKVLTMMQRRGITPNKVTWSSLAIGYARLQDITNTVDVIEKIENEGWEVDDITIKGLQVIENREGLMEALREKNLRRIKKQKLVQEAVERELASTGFGGLRDVVHKEQLFNHYENHARRASEAPGESKSCGGYRRPKSVRIREDEIAFLQRAHPMVRNEDQSSDALVSSTNS
jgi:pentatricopeptide repeat protein